MKNNPLQDVLREETPAEGYDRLYSIEGDANRSYGAYDRPYWDSQYYPF